MLYCIMSLELSLVNLKELVGKKLFMDPSSIEYLRKTKNIDVFVVADRAEVEGERVIPAIQTKKKEKKSISQTIFNRNKRKNTKS